MFTNPSFPTASYLNNSSTQTGTITSYGVHWAVPSDWFSTTYDDSSWQAATLFTNSVVGIDSNLLVLISPILSTIQAIMPFLYGQVVCS